MSSGPGSKSPLVSVIVSAYKRPDFLNQAMESVSKQTFHDFEIIVVDDASGEEFTSQYMLPPGARLICHKERKRTAAARNTGINASIGKFIALLDMDDIWLPDKLEAQVNLLESSPDCDFAHCHSILVDEALHPLQEQKKPHTPEHDQLRDMLRSCFIIGPSSVIVRREALFDCGLFDESVLGASDWDLYLRLLRRHRLASDPTPLTQYRISAGQMHKDRSLMLRAERHVLEKTLAWAGTERPTLTNLIRRRLRRILRSTWRMQVSRRETSLDAVETLLQAIRVWPWNPKDYLSLVPSLWYARPSLRRQEAPE